MHPHLFRFHVLGRDVGLPTYGLLVAVGFGVGAWLAERDARRRGSDPRAVVDACFWALVAGLVGARLLYIVTNAADYGRACVGTGLPRPWWRALADCTRVAQFWEGGLVFYGGFLGALAAVVLVARRRGVPFRWLADTLAPPLAAGHFFGRLGCYAAGCCFGNPTGAAWGARFPREALAFVEMAREGRVALSAERTPPLHPTQIYEAAGELALFAALLALRGRKRFDGQLFLLYLVAYPILRSMIELARGDAIRKFVVPGALSTSQAIGLAVLAGAAVLWRRWRT